MTISVRANVSENPSLQLSKEEMTAQMGALTLAGHETTSTTLSWALWELAKHPDIQTRLRAEIRDKRVEISLQNTDVGNSDLSMDDLEGMPFLQAFVKASSGSPHIPLYTVMTNSRIRRSCVIIPLSTMLYV